MSSRPPPGATPRSGVMNRVYGRNLRPVIFAITILGSIFALLWAIGSFKDIGLDKSQGLPQLATFSMVVGIFYSVTCAIETFGIFAAYSQKLALVRIYSFGSILSALLVVGAGFIRTIVHFIHKNDILSECERLSTGAEVSFRFGYWGNIQKSTLTAEGAETWCREAWRKDSYSEIASIVAEIILGTMFSMLALAYYRQLLDPTSVANASRAPSHQARTNMYPAHYNQPYNASVPNLGYNAPAPAYAQNQGGGFYAPPPGPPPLHGDEDAKLPGYSNNGEFMGKPDSKDDPFADFDGPSARRSEERDVTSRPRPGEPETFRV